MKFVSTRNKHTIVDSATALLAGLAADGGLFVPTRLPHCSLDLKQPVDFFSVHQMMLSLYFSDLDIDYPSLQAAYQQKFSHPKQIPLVTLDDDHHVLELFWGPSFSFKDVALTTLPYLLSASKQANKRAFILTATSGDTGSATLEAFKNIPNIKVGVFYPTSGVSTIQKALMQQIDGDNVFVYGIDGSFDDAQQAVKMMLEQKAAINPDFTSANSINIGRLLSQVAYYFYAIATWKQQNPGSPHQKVNVVVPSGNFGNILAGFIAKSMGCPIQYLICASNQNDVLTQFIQTGVYDRNRKLMQTTSPSMDILISSNVERLLYFLTNHNSQQVASWMNELHTSGRYQLDAKTFGVLTKHFIAESASEAEVATQIQATYQSYHYLIDPHTAVAMSVLNKVKATSNLQAPTIILSTASPFKFATTILQACNITPSSDPLDDVLLLSQTTNIPAPYALTQLKHKPIRFDQVIQASQIIATIRRHL